MSDFERRTFADDVSDMLNARERYCDNFVGGHEEWPAVWAMAEKSLDAVACIELVVAMSEVSEEWNCATWHSGIELVLAERAAGGSVVEERSGFLEVERREMASDVRGLALAIAAPVATAVGQMAVDAANHRRAEAKASRERWEALMAQAKEGRVKR